MKKQDKLSAKVARILGRPLTQEEQKVLDDAEQTKRTPPQTLFSDFQQTRPAPGENMSGDS